MVIATTFLTRFVYAVFNNTFGIFLFSMFGTYKYGKKVAVLLLMLAEVGCSAMYAGFCEIPHLTLFLEVVYWLISIIPIFIVQKLLSKDEFLRDCLLLLTQINVVMFMITSMYYFAMHVFSYDLTSSLTFSALTYVCIGACYSYAFKGVYKRMVEKTKPQRRKVTWAALLVIPCSFLVLQTLLFSIDDVSSSRLYFLIICFLATMMLIINIVLFWAFRVFEEKQKISVQNMQLSAQNTMWLNQLEQSERLVENTRRARHDLRHHDAFLLGLLEDKKYDEARSYVSEHLHRVETLHTTVYCKNKSINAILRAIYESARASDVFTTIEATIPEDFSADDLDMCGLFFNLAENAVNENKKLSPEKRYLTINATFKDDRLALSVVNPCADTVEMYKGHPVRKGDRDGGIGTQSVIDIVEKYNGIINYSYSNGTFTAEAILFGKKTSNGAQIVNKF